VTAYERGAALLAQLHGGHAGGAAVANALQTVRDLVAR
jgi:hypothetical protein